MARAACGCGRTKTAQARVCPRRVPSHTVKSCVSGPLGALEQNGAYSGGAPHRQVGGASAYRARTARGRGRRAARVGGRRRARGDAPSREGIPSSVRFSLPAPSASSTPPTPSAPRTPSAPLAPSHHPLANARSTPPFPPHASALHPTTNQRDCARRRWRSLLRLSPVVHHPSSPSFHTGATPSPWFY